MTAAGNAPAALLRAISFAAEKHRDHRRKGETAAPYINHPIAVAEQLAAHGMADETELLMAAVLHDVVEDTDATEAELAAAFGLRVAGIVMEVTDDKSLPQLKRKELAVDHIAGKSREARLLKLSDLISNVGDLIHHPPHWSEARKKAYLDWGEAVVRKLRGVHPELEERFDGLLAEARKTLPGE